MTAVGSGVLNATRKHCCAIGIASQRQDAEIDKICRRVEGDHDAGAQSQGERQIALRIFDLGGGEGDIVPGIGGKQRSHLGDGDNGDRAHPQRRTHALLHVVLRPKSGVLPEVPKVSGNGLVIPAHESSDYDQSKER